MLVTCCKRMENSSLREGGLGFMFVGNVPILAGRAWLWG